MGKVKSKLAPKKTPLSKNTNKAKTKIKAKTAVVKKIVKRPLKKLKTKTDSKVLEKSDKKKTLKAPLPKLTLVKELETKATTSLDPKAHKREIRPLNQKELDACRNKLLEMRQVILYKEYVIKEFTIDKNELSDVLDEATINDLMSKEVRLRNREIFHLKKINKSLEMIQRGTYGVCHDCDENIPFERMIVRPETDMCISCKENSENEEMRSINDKLPKSQGLSMEQVLGR